MKNRIVSAWVVALLLATAAFSQQAPAAPASASRADILRMFEVMHVRQQMRDTLSQMVQQTNVMMLEQLKHRRPDIAAAELTRMQEETAEVVKSYPVDALVEDVVPVYQKHLNKADVTAMIAFYSSRTGQKVLREMPAMTSEAMQAMYPRIQKQLDEVYRRLDAQEERK